MFGYEDKAQERREGTKGQDLMLLSGTIRFQQHQESECRVDCDCEK